MKMNKRKRNARWLRIGSIPPGRSIGQAGEGGRIREEGGTA